MTVANIDCDFDSQANVSGAQDETATTVDVRSNLSLGTDVRGQWRFPLAAIPAGSTINSVIFQANVTNESIESGDTIEIYAYDSDGKADPDADTAADKYTKSGAGSALVTGVTDFQATGSDQVDLGATACTLLQANISSPGRFSIGMRLISNSAVAEAATFESLENAGSDPATLIVDYTAATGTAMPPFPNRTYRIWTRRN